MLMYIALTHITILLCRAFYDYMVLESVLITGAGATHGRGLLLGVPLHVR